MANRKKEKGPRYTVELWFGASNGPAYAVIDNLEFRNVNLVPREESWCRDVAEEMNKRAVFT